MPLHRQTAEVSQRRSRARVVHQSDGECGAEYVRRYEFKKRADVEDEAVEWERSARTLTGEKLTDDRFAELIEQQVDFNEVMRRMNPDYKAVLLLHFDCGYTAKEIGKIMGKTENSVKAMLVRGKKQLVDLVTKGESGNE